MELKVKVYYTKECGDITSEDIYNKEHGIHFSVYNLTECPEDATVSRSLFSGEQYIRALNKGIELAQKGITKVIGEWELEE